MANRNAENCIFVGFGGEVSEGVCECVFYCLLPNNVKPFFGLKDSFFLSNKDEKNKKCNEQKINKQRYGKKDM